MQASPSQHEMETPDTLCHHLKCLDRRVCLQHINSDISFQARLVTNTTLAPSLNHKNIHMYIENLSSTPIQKHKPHKQVTVASRSSSYRTQQVFPQLSFSSSRRRHLPFNGPVPAPQRPRRKLSVSRQLYVSSPRLPRLAGFRTYVTARGHGRPPRLR